MGRGGLTYDSNFADSSQVTAERGEAEALAGKLREPLDEVERALDKLGRRDLRRVRGLWRAIDPPSRGQAGRPLLHQLRIETLTPVIR